MHTNLSGIISLPRKFLWRIKYTRTRQLYVRFLSVCGNFVSYLCCWITKRQPSLVFPALDPQLPSIHSNNDSPNNDGDFTTSAKPSPANRVSAPSACSPVMSICDFMAWSPILTESEAIIGKLPSPAASCHRQSNDWEQLATASTVARKAAIVSTTESIVKAPTDAAEVERALCLLLLLLHHECTKFASNTFVDHRCRSRRDRQQQRYCLVLIRPPGLYSDDFSLHR